MRHLILSYFSLVSIISSKSIQMVNMSIFLIFFKKRKGKNNNETKDNLELCHIIDTNYQGCLADCDYIEDIDHLFVKCNFYGRIWPLVACWFDFSTTTHKFLYDHLV